MGLTLVEISLAPHEEIALKAIQKINGDCQKKIDAAYAKRTKDSEAVLKQYIIDHAKYAVGDVLKAKQLEKYMEVESIHARVHFGSHVVIEYQGKSVKKVGAEFVPCVTDRYMELTERNALLIKNA